MKKWKIGLCAALALALVLMCVPMAAYAAAQPGTHISALEDVSPARTGDNSMLAPVIILLVLSAVGIAVLIVIMIRNRRK